MSALHGLPASPSPWAVSRAGHILCPFGCGGFVADHELNLLRLLRRPDGDAAGAAVEGAGALPASYYARAREWRVPRTARFASLVAIRSEAQLVAAVARSAIGDVDEILATPGLLELSRSGEVRFGGRLVALCALGSASLLIDRTVLKIRAIQGEPAQFFREARPGDARAWLEELRRAGFADGEQ